MVGHPLGVVLEVTELQGPLELLVGLFEMPIRVRHEDEVVLDNGSVSLRLLLCSEPRSRFVLDVDCVDLDAAQTELSARPGFSCHPAAFISTHREVLRVRTPYGFELWLGRSHDEDALGIEAELSTELCWSEEALETIRKLARQVPVAFRDLMREKTVARAETLAVARGSIEVDRSTALAAAIQMTPAFQLPRLRKQLIDLGVDVDRFAEDFER